MQAKILPGRAPTSAAGTRFLAALALTIQLAGCSSNVDGVQAKADLARANEKIASLESELAGLKAKAAQVTGAAPVLDAGPAAGAPAPAAPAPEPAVTGQQWSYSVNEEQMTGGKRKTASVASTNTVEFGFPYSGSQNGHLTLRIDPRHGKDVIFRIEQGQILCPAYDGCMVQVRFDDDKPTSYSATGPSDHSSEAVFLGDYARFIAKLRKAKRVRISPEIYQNGRPVFDFDVSGFDIDKYQAKS